jgi:PAT family beta-lactamase induction signal transducer AmpG
MLAALGTLGRTLVSGASGFVVDALGGNWAVFFLITAVMVLPSLVLLVFVGRMLRARIRQWEAEERAGPGGQGMAPATKA